jgi:hypothetical protein
MRREFEEPVDATPREAMNASQERGSAMQHFGSRMLGAVLTLGMGLFVAPGLVDAGLVKTGIQVDTTTVMPTGDPVYVIDFKLSLSVGYSLEPPKNFDDLTDPNNENSIIISNVPGAIGGTQYKKATGGKKYPFYIDQNDTNTTFSLSYIGSSPVVATAQTGAIQLGDFLVFTDIAYNANVPVPLITQNKLNLLISTLTTMQPSYLSFTQQQSTGQLFTGNGFAPAPAAVPEPGMIMLLLSGLPVAWLVHRRQRSTVA